MNVPINFVNQSLFEKAVYENDGRPYRRDLSPGTARWCEHNHALQFICPCGCGAIHAVATSKPNEPKSDGGWEWNADVYNPTLAPSLGLNPKNPNGSHHWHGYLTSGVFEQK